MQCKIISFMNFVGDPLNQTLASKEIYNKFCQKIHTHTHTHIYMYIYIYIYSVKLYFPTQLSTYQKPYLYFQLNIASRIHIHLQASLQTGWCVHLFVFCTYKTSTFHNRTSLPQVQSNTSEIQTLQEMFHFPTRISPPTKRQEKL